MGQAALLAARAPKLSCHEVEPWNPPGLVPLPNGNDRCRRERSSQSQKTLHRVTTIPGANRREESSNGRSSAYNVLRTGGPPLPPHEKASGSYLPPRRPYDKPHPQIVLGCRRALPQRMVHNPERSESPSRANSMAAPVLTPCRVSPSNLPHRTSITRKS